jgi:hypothetical protein
VAAAWPFLFFTSSVKLNMCARWWLIIAAAAPGGAGRGDGGEEGADSDTEDRQPGREAGDLLQAPPGAVQEGRGALHPLRRRGRTRRLLRHRQALPLRQLQVTIVHLYMYRDTFRPGRARSTRLAPSHDLPLQLFLFLSDVVSALVTPDFDLVRVLPATLVSRAYID